MSLSVSAFAQAPEEDAGHHVVLATRWRELRQFQKAIKEFEQAYLIDDKPLYLFLMAQSYEELASMPTRAVPEAQEGKMQALGLYQTFIEKAPQGTHLLEVARSRIAPLRQEIKELADQVTDREASQRSIQNDIKQILLEIRMLRGRGECVPIPTLAR